MDNQPRPICQLSSGFSICTVNAANLHRIHFQYSVLGQMDVADRVNAADTRAGTGADMLS